METPGLFLAHCDFHDLKISDPSIPNPEFESNAHDPMTLNPRTVLPL
jgi:hypothetical protein